MSQDSMGFVKYPLRIGNVLEHLHERDDVTTSVSDR
jgi:hypothetical protein